MIFKRFALALYITVNERYVKSRRFSPPVVSKVARYKAFRRAYPALHYHYNDFFKSVLICVEDISGVLGR